MIERRANESTEITRASIWNGVGREQMADDGTVNRKSLDPPYGSRLSRRDVHSLLGLCYRFQLGDGCRPGTLLGDVLWRD
jgi:hypothetical protein